MKIIIHRGAKEIGGSCVELQSDNTRIIVDIGMPLSNKEGRDFDDNFIENKSPEQLIKEDILPNVTGLYEGQQKQIDAVLISHSHKDHCGLLNSVNPEIPVYMSQDAKILTEILNEFIPAEHHLWVRNFKPVFHKKPFNIGSFRITPYLVDHSGYGAMSYLILDTLSGKSVFYSGDFRASGWKNKLFERFVQDPPKNVDRLLMEGTMIDREAGKYDSEKAVLDRVIEVLKTSDHKIILAYCSSQNIDRLVTFYKAARKTNSLLVIDPYTACVLDSIKNEWNHIPQMSWQNVRVLIANYPKKDKPNNGDKYVGKVNESSKLKCLIPDLGRAKINPREFDGLKSKALIVMRNGVIPAVQQIKNLKGSKLLYSQWEGYTKPGRSGSKYFWYFVKKNKLDIEYVHTSGHAVVEKLQEFANALNPKKLIPIHTSNPSKYKQFFKNVVILNDHQEYPLN